MKLLIWMHSTRQPLWSIPPESVDRLTQTVGEGWEVRSIERDMDATGDGPGATPRAVLEEIGEADVFFGFGIGRDAFLASRQLRWIHSAAAGVGGSLFTEMRESDVLLTNSAGIYAEPMADHAMAMILYFARGLDGAVAGSAVREWRREAIAGPDGPLTEVSGAVVGIVGYGGIGRAVGRRATALGMRVRATRRRVPTPRNGSSQRTPPADAEGTTGPDGLDELLAESDYVVLTVPETPETVGLIGVPELARMRDSAVLINIARGRILDEEALADALRSGRLRGAGLDVFREEPLPPDSLLWELDNALLTPHIGGTSPRFWERQTDLMVRNVRHFLAGRPLENLVDKETGY